MVERLHSVDMYLVLQDVAVVGLCHFKVRVRHLFDDYVRARSVHKKLSRATAHDLWKMIPDQITGLKIAPVDVSVVSFFY